MKYFLMTGSFILGLIVATHVIAQEDFDNFLRDLDTHPDVAEQEDDSPVSELEPQITPDGSVSSPETSETPADAPQYSSSQLHLLQITQAYNSSLQMSPSLMRSAQMVADYHASTGRWGHSSRSFRNGSSENIAWNSSSSVYRLGEQWKNSRGHRSNWLSSWNYVGVGVAYANGRIYGVQHFANNYEVNHGSTVSLRGSYTRRNVAPRRRLFWRFRRRR